MLDAGTAPLARAVGPAFYDDADLRHRVLAAYFETTRYLKASRALPAGAGVKSSAEFSIPYSCYIEETGHFNSVEFNICYNQMMYDALAHAAKYDLMEVFQGWGAEGFFVRQLPDILIVRFQSRFSQPIDSRCFQGEFAVTNVRRAKGERPMLHMKTSCRFFDALGGDAQGEVDLVILNP